VVTLKVVLEPRPSFPSRMLECRDCATGRLEWRYEFGARPDLMAVADLDSDGSEELLFATYGEENGAIANGTQDHDSSYCVALRDDGTRLWQRAFGAHPFSGCLAGVADLNRDGKPEVFVAGYTWQNDFGGLAVLDGATGRVIAASPPGRIRRRCHTSRWAARTLTRTARSNSRSRFRAARRRCCCTGWTETDSRRSRAARSARPLTWP
jgi:hypothetical protein